MLAQRHDLGFSPELINLIPLKHIEVDDLDSNTLVQGFVVSIVDNRRGAISCDGSEEAKSYQGSTRLERVRADIQARSGTWRGQGQTDKQPTPRKSVVSCLYRWEGGCHNPQDCLRMRRHAVPRRLELRSRLGRWGCSRIHC